MQGLEENIEAMNDKSKAVIQKNKDYVDAADSAIQNIGERSKVLKKEMEVIEYDINIV